MKISLLGWESSGLRSPDIKIDICKSDGSVPKVALIQMPNGTGKTTTLELLSATLNGSAERWNEEKILTFRRAGSEVSKGTFIVHLLINESPLSIELTINFENTIVSYRTTELVGGGLTSKWSPPPEVRKFLSEEFLKLFIFDGEFADDLLDSASSKADQAIDALCQLYLIDEVTYLARNELKKKTAKQGAKTEAGLNAKILKQNRLEERRTKIKNLKDKSEGEVIALSKRVEKLKSLIEGQLSSDKSTSEQFAKAKLELGNANSELKLITAEVVQLIRNPISIHNEIGIGLNVLKENLDELRLPENTSFQFFEELVEKKDCICGRAMTSGAQEAIRINAKQYLDTDDSGVLNALKTDVSSYLKKDEDKELHEKLADRIKLLKTKRRDEKTARQTVRALEKQSADQSNSQIGEWSEERDDKLTKLDRLNDILKSINSPGKEEKDKKTPISELFSLQLIENEIDEIDREIGMITKTVDFTRKVKLIESIADCAVENARASIRLELTKETNTRLQSILKNDPIQIEKIDKSIELTSQKGASVGQTLSVGYAFLMSVLGRGKNDFPLVVDSPANPIERVVRKELAELIPNLCHQFVAFTINTEFDGFVPVLKENSKDCKFLTLFRITEGTQRLMSGLPKKGVIKTHNAVLVSGYDYFKSFDQIDEGGI